MAAAAATTTTNTAAPAGAARPASPAAVVLFACIQNAGRSQMAAAFFNQLVDPASASAISAGTRPAAHVHPEVVEVMGELGIDLAAAQPQRLTPELAQGVAILVTMGCGDACPVVVPRPRVVEWQVPDACGQAADAVRSVRDGLRQQVLQLAQQEGYRLRDAAAA